MLRSRASSIGSRTRCSAQRVRAHPGHAGAIGSHQDRVDAGPGPQRQRHSTPRSRRGRRVPRPDRSRTPRRSSGPASLARGARAHDGRRRGSRAHGASPRRPARRFDAEDWWFRAKLPNIEDPGRNDASEGEHALVDVAKAGMALVFEGLATVADVWLDGAPLCVERTTCSCVTSGAGRRPGGARARRALRALDPCSPRSARGRAGAPP